jgi:hypothetical protein
MATFSELFDVKIDYNDATISVIPTEFAESLATWNYAYLKIIAPGGSVAYENAGYDTETGTADIVIPVSTFTTSIPSYSDGAPIEGDYTVYAKASYGTYNPFPTRILSKTFTYCFDAPSVDITMSYDCLATSLTVSDNTDYSMDCASGNIDVSIVRNLTINPPQTTAPGVTPPSVINAGNVTDYTTSSLWTMVYTANYENTVIYTYPCGLLVEADLGAYDTIEVECSDCLCNFATCIKSLYYKYISAKTSGSYREAEKLSEMITELNVLYNMYTTALRCGRDDAQEYCNRIVALLDFAGVNCCNEDTDGYSTQVVGVYGTGSSTTGNSIHIGTGVPFEGIPIAINGDIYIDDTAPNAWYQYIGASGWVFQFNLQGDTGNDGSSSGVVTDADYTVDSLADYAFQIPVNAVNGISDEGDRIKLRAWFRFEGIRSKGSFIRIYNTSSGGVIGDGDGNFDRTIDTEETEDKEYGILIEADFNNAGDKITGYIKYYYNGDYTGIITTDTMSTDSYMSDSYFNVVVSISNLDGVSSVGYDTTFYNSIIE